MLRELPDGELTDNPDYQRWLFVVQRGEWEAEEKEEAEHTKGEERKNL